MNFWTRAATLQIGAKRYSLDGLNFSFEVSFEDSTTLCAASIKAYNLSAATRGSIQKGAVVIINAGYEGAVGAIFVGQVSDCKHKKENMDWVTELSAAAALDEWVGRQVNKTYTREITAKNILSDLLNIFGLEVGEFQLAVDKAYPRGRVCCGKLKDVLEEITVKDCKSRLLIKNGRLIINDPAKGMNMGYLLSPESGLLRASGDKEETEIASEQQKTFTRECLLNYHLGAADQIKIKSQSLNGDFLIVKGKHIGSQSGDWKTQIEVKPL